MGKIVFSAVRGVTAVDNIFIDEYMCRADSPVFSLIYIYGIRCAVAGIEVTNEEIAQRFNILESEVVKAWQFWEKQSAVAVGGTKDNPEISFLPLKAESKVAENPEIAVTKEVKKIEPVYNPTDIGRIMSGTPELKEIIASAEITYGKTLNVNETAMIVKMYDWLGMSGKLIYYLLTYCVNKGHKSMAYIEKVAMDWHEKGITTVDQAEEYISVIDDYGKIMGFCGLNGRSPVKSQQEFMYKWLNHYKMPLAVIEQACTRAIETTGKATFKYINSIIENWYKKGVKTIKDIEKADAQYFEGLKQKQDTKTTAAKPVNNKFINYNQPDYSQEQWEEILARKAKANEL